MRSDWLFKVFMVMAFPMTVIVISCNKSYHYEYVTTDSRSAEQVAARVSVEDKYGRPVMIDGKSDCVDYLARKWCYTDGKFSVTLHEKGGVIRIQRGPETLPATVPLTKSNGRQTIKLQRWTDRHQTGYMNGDIHIHTPFSTTAKLEMMAEDLDFLNILVGEDSVKNRQFTGEKDAASNTTHTIYVAQEVRDWQMGHLTLLGLKTMVPGYPIVGGTLESYSHTNRLMSRAMDETHKQGGMVIWSHFSNLPGAESAVAIALGKVDGLELMTYDDPTQLPSHWGPWKNSGMPVAEFPVLRGMDLYYQYLNAGFRLPIAAGTDKMADDIPMGSNRFYAFTNGDTSYAAWLTAIRSGHGFITNSPILTFDVKGHIPGDVVDFTGNINVHATVVARSVLPFATLEIVRNGLVVGHKTIFVPDNPPVDGIYTMKLETDIDLEKSSWIAARIADDPDNKNRILPRGLSVFAHTNPVWFLRDGKKVREEASIRYLQKYVRGTIHWLETKPAFENPEDRLAALKLANEALMVYESMLN